MLEINGYVRSDFKWVPWLFPGINRQQRDAKHSPISTAEAETKWIFTSTSLPYLNVMNEANLPLTPSWDRQARKFNSFCYRSQLIGCFTDSFSFRVETNHVPEK